MHTPKSGSRRGGNHIVARLWHGWRFAVLAAAAGMAIAASAVPADKAVHQGVASCAGSTCHGRQQATGPRVRQNEVLTWSDPASVTGVHSRAWRVLNEPRAQAMGKRLGIANVAAAKECIGCHGDPAPARGPQWQQSDGVGCEACHGGAERWLASHASVNAAHADNVARGMWALNDPLVRAGVCLDCHFGADKPGQFVFHRIMAAGHPRLTFELDLFTALQRHHDEDADYKARKGGAGGVAGGVKIWAVGQALAVERALALLPVMPAGLTGPDFGFYDCRSCHRTFSDNRAAPIAARTNGWRPIPPGQPVWNDEQLIMLAAAAKVAAPDAARSFEAQSRAFHTAMAGDRAGAMKAAATLKAAAATLARRFASASFDRAQGFALIDAVLVGNAAAYTDYQGGAQAVMAADTLLNALVAAGQVDRGAAAAMRPDFERAYALTRDANRWDAAALQAALAQIAARVRGLR